MNEFILLLLGGLGGFLLHTTTMKVSFKQGTIERKIGVFDSLIGTWVTMRNFVYAKFRADPDLVQPSAFDEFDLMYGNIQQFIGQAFLVCEDDILCADINGLTEQLYRTDWSQKSHEEANATMEQIKLQAINLIARMREDVKSSSRFEWKDLTHIVSGLLPCKKN